MAMVWFILRDEDDVWLWDVREIRNTRFDGVFRVEKFGMPHGTGSIEPWVDEYTEGSRRLLIFRLWEWLFRREGEKKSTVGIEMFASQRHDVVAGFHC